MPAMPLSPLQPNETANLVLFLFRRFRHFRHFRHFSSDQFLLIAINQLNCHKKNQEHLKFEFHIETYITNTRRD